MVYRPFLVLALVVREKGLMNKAEFQELIIGLAGGSCEVPGCKTPGLAVRGHHIVYLSQGGENARDNGVALCIGCHHKGHNGLGLHGISGHQFVVNLLTELTKYQVGNERWGEKLKEIKDRWNL